ncbi:MAG: ATP-binding protein [Betaproteobacteria bacterium]|nr:ATP-binding protein [Betaproteobacteria bacterium]
MGKNDAVYLPQVIEEYKGNPFIEALPPILSVTQAVKALTVEPGYHESERELDAYYRFHCIQRLFRYFQPLDTHIDIEQRISRSIRQGYVNRNPMQAQYVQRLRQCGEAVQKRAIEPADFQGVRSTAAGFTVIGMSGVGKTTSMERVLSLYPQCVTHMRYNDQPFYVKQLVWLKLDCPFDGSIKGLCLSFFGEVDRLLDSDYSKVLLPTKNTVDSIMPKMAQVASTHGLGLLVIDEIQHLSTAKSGGSEKMLNFFVTLVNTIDVPVVLIGTTKAMPILQSEFRQARRGSGQGDLLWDRMPNDLSWEIMLQSMWRYQWTRQRCALTKEMSAALYNESQGIMDIAVKLYAMAQIKAITDGTELVTVRTVREVAAEKLRLVKPMLDALRSGDTKKLLQFEDIRPISVEDYLAAQATRLPPVPEDQPTITSLEEQAILKLLEMDIPSKTARQCVKKALKGASAGLPLSKVVQKAFRLALMMDEPAGSAALPAADENDIRQTVDYDGIKDAGVIADNSEW